MPSLSPRRYLAVFLCIGLLGGLSSPATVAGATTEVTRLAGADRYATAAAISKSRFAGGASTAFIATGATFPDALAGAPAAAKANAPILLTTPTQLPSATARELTRLKVKKIVVLGGTSAVSPGVVAQLKSHTSNVVRWSGADRFATAAKISASSFGTGGTVYVATARSFPDALSGGAIAGKVGGPILLVDTNAIPGVTASELKRIKPARIIVLGGSGVVSDAVAKALRAYAGSVSRLAGADRYATSVAVSKSVYGGGSSAAFVATGTNYPDGLAGGPVAALLPGPLLLVTRTSLPSAVGSELRRLAPTKVFVLGSSGAVSDGVVSAIRQTLSTGTSSGVPAPVGDLPGWKQIFVDDFGGAVPLGSFPVSSNGRWSSYGWGARDTSRNGVYSTPRVVSVANGVLRKHLHYADGDYHVAALMPVLPDGGVNQLYGRYAVRFRADAVEGYKVAWLLWPQSERWPADGEIDFPEGDLTGSMCAFMHRTGATSGSDQDAYCTTTGFRDWHTAVIEWAPGSVKFFLDGRLIGHSTSRVPNTPMRWVLQTETRLGGGPPPPSAAGNVEIDWVAIWRYAP
jgi:putative cell wall-binding protein